MNQEKAHQKSRQEAAQRHLEDLEHAIRGRVTMGFVSLVLNRTKRCYVLGPQEKAEYITKAQNALGGRYVRDTLKMQEISNPRTGKFWVLTIELAYSGHRELARWCYWIFDSVLPAPERVNVVAASVA